MLGFTDGLDMVNERRKGRNAAYFYLSHKKDEELLSTEMRMTEGQARFGG